MGLQVATNLIQGEKWYKIDVQSVLISAGAGAVGAGVASKVKQAKRLVDLGKAAVAAGEALTEAVVSSAESVVRQCTYDGSVSLEETLTDAAIGGGSSLFGSGAKEVKRASSRGKQELRTLEDRLDRAKRVARGNDSKPSRKAAVEKAKNDIESYGDKNKKAVSVGTDFMVSTFKEYMFNMFNNEGRGNK